MQKNYNSDIKIFKIDFWISIERLIVTLRKYVHYILYCVTNTNMSVVNLPEQWKIKNFKLSARELGKYIAYIYMLYNIIYVTSMLYLCNINSICYNFCHKSSIQ